jgi:hypothetical protein
MVGLQGGWKRIRSAAMRGYPTRVPRIWAISMVILVLCLLASIVIATVKLAAI